MKYLCLYPNDLQYFIQLEDATDDTTLQNMLRSDNFDFRFECGVIQSAESYTMLQKPKILRLIATHYAVYSKHNNYVYNNIGLVLCTML